MEFFDISQLVENNPWWIKRDNIFNDFKLSSLSPLKYKWDPNIRHYILLDKDSLFTIRGPRQVGKTTLMKLIIKDLLLNKQVDPKSIFFWSSENNSASELSQIVSTYLNWQSNNEGRKYLFLDEICAVKDWRKELIHFANKGSFKNCSIVVTGSHSMDLKHSTELMPGRRGGDGVNPLDKILLPMKFAEFVTLLYPEMKQVLFDLGLVKRTNKRDKMVKLFKGEIDKSLTDLMVYKEKLDKLFEDYLLCGGIPSTINEFKETGKISTNLFNVYITAIIGDLRQYNYKDHYFKQIMKEIFKVMSTPVSWNSFTKNTDAKHHSTVQDYITAMEELYIVNVSYPLSIDGKSKPFMKKMYVSDPFIFHALHGWSNAKQDYFSNAKENLLNLEIKSKLVESVVYNHLCRFMYGLNPRDLFDPKDYIFYYHDKNKREIDFLLSFDNNRYPIEVKYQATTRSSDFFNFKIFNKGVLVTKNQLGVHRTYTQIPVSLFLLLI